MKEQIVAIMSYPHLDKLVIQVYRQYDRFHLARSLVYTARYEDENKARKLMKNFIKLNELLQFKLINNRIEERKKLYANNS